MPEADVKTFEIRYSFRFENNTEKVYTIRLNQETLRLISGRNQQLPEWTRLEFHQCPNCPLKPEENPHCPVAEGLVEITEGFRECVSFEKADVLIKTGARAYRKEVPTQKGLSSLMGIAMVTSGCPILGKLKPMVRHHLPFADMEETQYRVLSMYLLAQYLRSKKGLKADWDLEHLPAIYNDIMTVNRGFAERIKSVSKEDALPNALVILNTLADSVVFSLDTGMLTKMEKIFADYLSGELFEDEQ